MDPFNLSQLTKAMVQSQLRNLADPTLVAADVVRGTVLARLRGRPPLAQAQLEIAEICRGAVAGMALMECPLERGCAAALAMVLDAARILALPPEAVLAAATQGLSDARRFCPPEALPRIRAALDRTSLGAGELFLRFCRLPAVGQSHPAYVPPA